MSKNLIDEILDKVEITYNKMEVDEWFESLEDEAAVATKNFVKTFMRMHPKLGIYAFNFVMQTHDGTIEVDNGTIVKLSNYEDVYYNGSTRRSFDSHRATVQLQKLQQQRSNSKSSSVGPLTRLFNSERDPYSEYKAFIGQRDLGDNMAKLIKEVNNLKNSR